MNEKNFQFLTDDLDKMGLEDHLNQLFRKKIESNLFDEFSGTVRVSIGKDKMEITPHVKRSEDPEYRDYFNINHVKVKLSMENGDVIQIRFPHFKELKFNKEQMYQMVKEMAPVYKKARNEKIGQWAKVDKNATDEEGFMKVRTYPDNETNFRLERHLDNLKVSWARGEKDNAIMDLQNGIPVTAMIRENGQTIEAVIKVAAQINALVMVDQENNVLQRTNTSNVTMEVVEEVKKENLPATTKDLMNNKNNTKKNEGKKNSKIA